MSQVKFEPYDENDDIEDYCERLELFFTANGVQTSQLSRFGRETHGFKAILTVSRSNANFSLSFTVTHCFLTES